MISSSFTHFNYKFLEMRSKWKIFLNCYNFIKGRFLILFLSHTRFDYEFFEIKRDRNTHKKTIIQVLWHMF